MSPATRPPVRRDAIRLLVIDRRCGELRDRRVVDLPTHLDPGDLLVVNDAATLPASLFGRTTAGAAIELRLTGAGEAQVWRAVVFGAGDWRTPTEARPAPPTLAVGDVLRLGDLARPLEATITAIDPRAPRLLTLRFDVDEDGLWAALYRAGAPIQYAYLEEELALWSVQSAFAGPPWAAEMASAGRPLSWKILGDLRRRGVAIASLTHAAGLSSTGDAALDALLPLPERYAIPAATVAAIHRTKAAGGRVIAVGTTVIRALEGCVRDRGALRPGVGVTDLLLDHSSALQVVDGVLTGMHGPGESHRRLLEAFAPPALLDRAWAHAVAAGYRAHELGDVALVTDLAA